MEKLNFKKRKLIEETEDLRMKLKNHANFSHFLQPISFENYLNSYTTSSEINMKEEENEGSVNSLLTHSTQFLLNNSTNENIAIILKLTKALTNPLTINLIYSLLNQNDN
jgi:hypothetical protein